MRRLLLALLAASLAACSTKNLVADRLDLCSGGSCRGLPDGAKGELARALYGLMRDASGMDLILSEEVPGSVRSRGKGIRVFTQGGPMPAVYKGKALRVTDVLYLDPDEGVVRFKARLRGTFLFVPVLCLEGTGTLRVLSSSEARLELSNVCTWLGPTSYWKLDGLIDRVDLDAKLLGMRYSLKGGGVPVVGGGSGYLLAKLEGEEAEEPAAAPRPAPAAPSVPLPAPSAAPPAPTETSEALGSVPAGTLNASLSDAGGDLVIDAGEAFTLKAAVENAGAADLPGVRLVLTGSQALLAALPSERGLGGLPSGGAARSELTGTLAPGTPSQAATLRVEALAEPGGVLLGAKTFRVALRGAAREEEVEVLSELDVDELPARTAGVGGPHDAALVVGISRYRDKEIPAARYAARDAELVARYLERVAGVPAANIKLLVDDTAAKSDIEAYLTDWLPRRVKADSRVFVYFAGHGTPDLSGQGGLLVPYEGQPDFPSKLLPVKEVLAALERLPAKETVVALDSCFSGAGGRSLMAPGARPLVAALETPLPEGRVAVLSAAQGGQISSDYDKARHGLFTYALLRGLRGEADADKDGKVLVGELHAYVKDLVARRASLELNRDQTPTLQAASGRDIQVSSTRP